MITFDVNQDKNLMVFEELEVDRDIKNDEDTVTDLYYRANLYKARSSASHLNSWYTNSKSWPGRVGHQSIK